MSAKERFLQTAHAKRFAEIIKDPAVISALDHAMLYFCETASSADVGSAAATGFQLKGAGRFRNLLESIATKPNKPQTQNMNLDE